MNGEKRQYEILLERQHQFRPCEHSGERPPRSPEELIENMTTHFNPTPVAVPVFWEEVNGRLKPDQFNVKNILIRLKSMKKDPWADFFSLKQSLRPQFGLGEFPRLPGDHFSKQQE